MLAAQLGVVEKMMVVVVVVALKVLQLILLILILSERGGGLLGDYFRRFGAIVAPTVAHVKVAKAASALGLSSRATDLTAASRWRAVLLPSGRAV